MGIFRPQKYIFMSIKLFTIFSIKCYEESHKINEWKFSCDTTIAGSAKQMKLMFNLNKNASCNLIECS